MTNFPEIDVDVTFLPPGEGGRPQLPELSGPASYRPHLVVGDPDQRKPVIRAGNFIAEDYLGVQFKLDGRPFTFGVPRTATLELIYYRTIEYERLIPGATFTVREGPRIVAFGTVLSPRRMPS